MTAQRDKGFFLASLLCSLSHMELGSETSVSLIGNTIEH